MGTYSDGGDETNVLVGCKRKGTTPSIVRSRRGKECVGLTCAHERPHVPLRVLLVYVPRSTADVSQPFECVRELLAQVRGGERGDRLRKVRGCHGKI